MTILHFKGNSKKLKVLSEIERMKDSDTDLKLPTFYGTTTNIIRSSEDFTYLKRQPEYRAEDVLNKLGSQRWIPIMLTRMVF